MYRQQPQKDILGLQSESCLSRAYHKAKRAALVGTAAFLAYFGLGASSQQVAPAYAHRAPVVQNSVPDLSFLTSLKQDKPNAAQQEKDLAEKAEKLYNKGLGWSDTNRPYSIERLGVLHQAYHSFLEAENLDKTTTKFQDGVTKSQVLLTSVLLEYLQREKDLQKADEAYRLVKDAVKSDDETKKRLAELLKPVIARKESDAKKLADTVYESTVAGKWKDKEFSDDRIQEFKNAYAAFNWAEDIDASSKKFGEYLDQKIPDQLAFIALSRMEKESDGKKVKEWFDAYSQFEGKDCFAALSDGKHRQKLDELLDKHGIQHKPYFVKQEWQEKELEAKAAGLYAKFSDSEAWKAKGIFPLERLEIGLEAFNAYREAEAADPSSMKYGIQFKHVSNLVSLNALYVIKEEKDPAKAKALYERLSKYEGKDFDFFPLLSDEKNKALLDEELNNHGIQHKPYYVKPADAKTAQDDQNKNAAATQDDQNKEKKGKDDENEKFSPYSADRIAANLEAGSRKSTQDRSASLDVKIGGFQVIAHGDSNKFREATSRDKVREKEFGAYAGIDFDRIFGVPLEFSASFDERTVTRDSFDFGETDSPSFNIKTFTDTTTEESMRYLAARAAFDFREFKLGVTGFNKLLTTDVDVLTRLEVINKSDPSGNYTDFITNNLKFETDILGSQFSLEVPVSDRVSMGTLATLEFTDMEDFNRDIDLYRFHIFGKYRSANGRFGINALVGEALLDDSGEEDDGWKKGEYNLVAAYQLSDSFLFGGRFTYLTNPRGSLFFLFGKKEGALDALLEQYWQEGMADLDLLKHMSEEQQKDYILGRRRDLVRGLADHNSLMLLGDIGAARVNRPMEGESVEFNGRVTLFIPIDDFTLTVTPYIDNADLFRRFGAELTGQKKGSRWLFGVDVAKEEDFSGHLEEEEDIRGMFWARYALGSGKK